MKGVSMWGTNNNNSNNSFIWLILLILIFFTQGSSTISSANYFRLTDNVTNTNNLLNGLFN